MHPKRPTPPNQGKPIVAVANTHCKLFGMRKFFHKNLGKASISETSTTGVWGEVRRRARNTADVAARKQAMYARLAVLREKKQFPVIYLIGNANLR